MTTVLTALHILAAILLLGPVALAVSTFHTFALNAHNGDESAKSTAKLMYKITNVYGLLSLLVPLLGVAVMFLDSTFLRDGRFHTSIFLSVIAWGILFFFISPRQKKLAGALGLLDDDEQEEEEFKVVDWAKAKKQLAMLGGIFNLIWVIIFVLMVIPAW